MTNPFKPKPTIASALKMFHSAISDLNDVALEARGSQEATEAEATKLDLLALAFKERADEALRLASKLTAVIE